MILANRTGLVLTDQMTDEIEQLTLLATPVLTAHADDGASCAICHGEKFPCPAALLAQGVATLRQDGR